MQAGSKYNISVEAVSAHGSGPQVSITAWTQVGQPSRPKTPTLIRHHQTTSDGTIHAKLYPVEELYGPITAYWVLVLDETTPTPFNNQTLYGYEKARREGLSYWITAQLEPSFLNTQMEFVIGDNKMYGGFRNYGPLLENDYHVSLGAISKLNGVTKISLAKVSHDQHAHDNIIVFKFHGDDDDAEDHDHDEHYDHDEHQGVANNGVDERSHYTLIENDPAIPEPETMSSVLIVAIVVASVLLVATVLFFVFIRYSVINRLRRRRDRRRADTQELTANMPPTTIAGNDPSDNNGYIDNVAFDGEASFKSAEDYLESLDNKVWQIPRNFVEVKNEILGRGRFGTVMSGIVNIDQEAVNANVYIIPNKMMERSEHQSMLRHLDLNVKAKVHDNIVNLIGICEEKETTLIVLDAIEMELKQFLLDSRSLVNHPSYAAKADRFTNLREEDALGMMVGIAQGLQHLVNSGVQIKDMSARNIFISSGLRPKVFGFGLADYNKRAVSLDFTRWNAPETLLKNHLSSKSLIWSYGCVMWEIASLGMYTYMYIFHAACIRSYICISVLKTTFKGFRNNQKFKIFRKKIYGILKVYFCTFVFVP